MLEGIFNNYLYEDKSCPLSTADLFLAPTRFVLGYETLQSQNNGLFREEDAKCESIALRILLAPVALLLIPITFVACIVKLLSDETQKTNEFYLSFNQPFVFTTEKLNSLVKKGNPEINCEIPSESLHDFQTFLEDVTKGFKTITRNGNREFVHEDFSLTSNTSPLGTLEIVFHLTKKKTVGDQGSIEGFFRSISNGYTYLEVMNSLVFAYVQERHSKEIDHLKLDFSTGFYTI